MARVFVQRVIVEYVSDNKLFKVEFDPNKVGSIFFRKEDLEAQKKGQSTTQGPPLNGSTPLGSQGVDPGEMGVKSEAVPVATAATVSGPELWWHTNTCTFFHPNEAPA